MKANLLISPSAGFGIVTGIAIGVVLSLSFGAGAQRADSTDDVLRGLPIDELRSFAEVYSRVKRHYVTEVDDADLLNHAIRGMLSGLDPHSAYLDASEYRDLQVGTSGEFGGLGIEVGMESGFVRVIAPIDDTPASRAGLRPGDLITRIDDTAVQGLTLNEAVQRMRGPRGSEIVLTIVREGEDRPISVTLVRDTIRVRSVRAETLAPGFGYVRITNFQARTARDLVRAIEDLQAESKLRGLVLDLRNNPGGVLNASVGVTDVFLDGGLIVYTEGRLEDSQFRYSASPGDALDGAPLVVLVNEGSASASEIVAGALQDHGRAVIMGSTTFGKGSVQTILPLGRDTALKLTTARYFTPEGRIIQSEGIRPDIEVAAVTVQRSENNVASTTERNLRRHLENPQSEEGAASSDEESSSETLAERDFAIHEALNLLRGLDILNRRGDSSDRAEASSQH